MLMRNSSGSMDVLNLSGSRRNFAAAVFSVEDGRSGDDHIALSVLARLLSSSLPSQLDLSLLHGRLL